MTERHHAAGELGHDDLNPALAGAVSLVSDHRDAHLARTLAGDDLDHREDDDLEVGNDAAPGDVLEVAADHAVEPGGVALRDLPPAGDAGLHGKALQVVLGVLRHLVGQRRARAHDGHLAQEHVDELRELVDGVLADELADPGDARVLFHLEHGAGDLVLPLELGEALVGVLVHAAELPHAEGGQAAVAVGLAHANLTVERVALALQADGRRQHKARDGDDGQHAAAEHDVEGTLHGAVAQASAIPVLHGLHGLVAHAHFTIIHGLGNKRGPHRRVLPCHFVSSQVQIHVPVPRDPPIDEFKLRMIYRCNVPLRLTGHVQRKQLPKRGVAFAHVYQAPAFMTVDLLHPGLLPHQRALLYVKNAVFDPRDAVAHHAVVVEHAAIPVLRIVRHGRIGPLLTAGNAAAKAQLGQSPIERGGIARGDEEILLVHGFGLERPGAAPLKPELLLHHKSVLHQLVRDNAADLFAGLALFSIGSVDQIPADAAALAVGSGAAKGTGQLLLAPHCLFHVSPPSPAPRRTRMQGR